MVLNFQGCFWMSAGPEHESSVLHGRPRLHCVAELLPFCRFSHTRAESSATASQCVGATLKNLGRVSGIAGAVKNVSGSFRYTHVLSGARIYEMFNNKSKVTILQFWCHLMPFRGYCVVCVRVVRAQWSRVRSCCVCCDQRKSWTQNAYYFDFSYGSFGQEPDRRLLVQLNDLLASVTSKSTDDADTL